MKDPSIFQPKISKEFNLRFTQGDAGRSSRLIETDSVRQDLERRIRDRFDTGYTELRADLVFACRGLVSGQG